MELNGYRFLLPEGTLEYFALVDVKESVNEVVIYLEEKNIVPEKYTDQDTESKGFYDPITTSYLKHVPYCFCIFFWATIFISSGHKLVS